MAQAAKPKSRHHFMRSTELETTGSAHENNTYSRRNPQETQRDQRKKTTTKPPIHEDDLQVGGSKRQKNVVIAIDFGTVNSGIAFSFKDRKDEIKSAHYGGFLEQDRVPTGLLLYPNKTFHSFGYEAERNYSDLPSAKRRKFFYMKNFKKKIYEANKIQRDMKIQDSSGKMISAMTVFSMAIEYMKDLAQGIVLKSKMGLKEDDIQWMITIPAISSDSARQFMREASVAAGIPVRQLKLALEPEAAALYCMPRLQVDAIDDGFKYIIADLGGGTSDICVHETIENGKLREIYRASGVPVGGSNVDEEFETFMINLIGEFVWREFSSEHPSAYVNLMNEFQTKKKLFRMGSDAVVLKMENALLMVIKSMSKGSTLQSMIKHSNYADKLGHDHFYGTFIIYREVMERLFTPSVNAISETLKKILEECQDNDIKTILLAGGYSESPYLRERLEKEFDGMRFVVNVDSRLAVLNGAVMMGWEPRLIKQRMSRFTYGVSVLSPFVEGIHPEYLKYVADGRIWCSKIFRKLVEKGQMLEYGQAFKHKGYNTANDPESKHSDRYTALYSSTKKDPEYCTDEDGCNLVGHIVKLPPREGWPNFWEGESCLIMGETEFTVKDINLTKRQEHKVQIDFL